METDNTYISVTANFYLVYKLSVCHKRKYFILEFAQDWHYDLLISSVNLKNHMIYVSVRQPEPVARRYMLTSA